ncbi:hypothetical protein ACIHCX_11885 [Streptomyces sp. NPDC052043]|uniref:hypothetical protein n=1 Tax=Streptomyces sp. NPDC052043 TaxID=3365684 RepID=UPI0037CCE82E
MSAKLSTVLATCTSDGLPPAGWQATLVPLLRAFADEEPRIHELRPHGSAQGNCVGLDRWSDLDVLLITPEPVSMAEALAERIRSRCAPEFASNRSGDWHHYTLRVVLRDLRRIDISAAVPPGHAATAPRDKAGPGKGGPMDELINDFRFDAVLASIKAARDDVLIGGHLALQLARHVLAAAMLLRDRDAGTTHHRFGGTKWDAWASVLGSAPAPYTRRGTTAAIRYYTNALADLTTAWDPGAQLDNGPLMTLLDAVDASSPSTARGA